MMNGTHHEQHVESVAETTTQQPEAGAEPTLSTLLHLSPQTLLTLGINPNQPTTNMTELRLIAFRHDITQRINDQPAHVRAEINATPWGMRASVEQSSQGSDRSNDGSGAMRRSMASNPSPSSNEEMGRGPGGLGGEMTMNGHVTGAKKSGSSRSGEEELDGCSQDSRQAAADSRASSSSVWGGVNGDHQSTTADDEGREAARELGLIDDE